MHFPLTIVMRPSRRVMASILALHIGAGLALFHVPALSVAPGAWMSMPGLATLAAWGTVLLSLVLALRAERAKGAVVLTLHGNGLLSRGEGVAARSFALAGGHVDLGWAVWLPLDEAHGSLRRRCAWFRPRLMLMRANLPASHWRPLRIWIRHMAAPADEG
jgi:hypothetical protein